VTGSRPVWKPASIAVVLSVLLGTYIWLGAAVATVASVRNQFRLPQSATGRALRPQVSDTIIDRALQAAPTSQSIYNAHVVARAAETPGSDLRAPLALLRKLGWRDPTSVQNIISNALVTSDLSDIAQAGDALLRQDALVDEATQLMVLLEAFPDTWAGVATRLAQNVPWRYRFLEKAGSLSSPDQLDGRLKTLSALQARGDRLKRQEVAPFVTLMADNGRIAEARKLWLGHVGGKSAILFDSDFELALKQSVLLIPTTPFEWSFQNGVGYVADVASNGLQGARISIQWDGRSVPLFLLQRTGAGPGRYRLHVRVEGEPLEFDRRIGFRLRCDAKTVAFDDASVGAGSVLVLTTPGAVDCNFPVLDVFGKLQEPRRAVDVAFMSVQIEPIN
jgi:hypothetical protein